MHVKDFLWTPGTPFPAPREFELKHFDGLKVTGKVRGCAGVLPALLTVCGRRLPARLRTRAEGARSSPPPHASHPPSLPQITAQIILVEAPTKAVPIKCLVGTWNVGNEPPPAPADLQPWLKTNGGQHELVAIGAQECTYKERSGFKDCDVRNRVSPPPAPARVRYHRLRHNRGCFPALPLTCSLCRCDHVFTHLPLPALARSPTGSAPSRPLSGRTTSACARTRSARCASRSSPAWTFSRLSTGALRNEGGEVASVILSSHSAWLRESFACWWRRSPPYRHESMSEATGVGHVGSNKGGIASCVHVWDTSVCFVNSHLAAHQGKTSRRNSDYKEIVEQIQMGMPGLDILHQFHHVVWVGDLNYRLDLGEVFGPAANAKTPPKEVFDRIQEMCASGDTAEMLKCDQLRKSIADQRGFVGFTEGDIKHLPTFKVKRTAGFEYNVQRSPAYCDRILWRSLPGLGIKQARERAEAAPRSLLRQLCFPP